MGEAFAQRGRGGAGDVLGGRDVGIAAAEVEHGHALRAQALHQLEDRDRGGALDAREPGCYAALHALAPTALAAERLRDGGDGGAAREHLQRGLVQLGAGGRGGVFEHLDAVVAVVPFARRSRGRPDRW